MISSGEAVDTLAAYVHASNAAATKRRTQRASDVRKTTVSLDRNLRVETSGAT
jgi:hypothetical protein